MFGLGLEAVTLHRRVSLLPSKTVLSRGYVVCNDGESERRQRLLVSSVKCLYDINAKTECTDWNVSEIVCVAGAWKLFCKKERGFSPVRSILSYDHYFSGSASQAIYLKQKYLKKNKNKNKKNRDSFGWRRRIFSDSSPTFPNLEEMKT